MPQLNSENFHRSESGMPNLSRALSNFLLVNFKAAAVYLLPTTLDNPVSVGPTTSFNITPVPVPVNFIAGPIIFKAPRKAVPSVPNLSLFLRIAAALSLPFNPSMSSNFVDIKAF